MDLIADRLRERRKCLKFTKKIVAEKAGISAQAYAYLEAGERAASYAVALLLSLALQTSIAYLTGETDNSAPDRILLKIDDAEDISALISGYRHLSPDDKRLIRDMVEKLKR